LIVKKAYWAGAVLILAFFGLGLTTFSKSMTPYVTFEEAKESGRTVQVMGALEKGSSRYDTESKTLFFTLIDEKTRSRCHRLGREAPELRDAISIVPSAGYERELRFGRLLEVPLGLGRKPKKPTAAPARERAEAPWKA
jgi:cytochrome c-type biogenesis protein CcmE